MSSRPGSHRRATASQSSISSPLAQAPKFSLPTSTSRPASPTRKPLHERSNSQSNRAAAPTIRIVGDNEVYSKFPIPSEPSQILPPPRHAPGYAFEQPASRVSSSSKVANAIAKFEATKSLEPQTPLPQRKKASRHSASTSNSEADTLVASSFTPPSFRFSRERFSQASTSTLPSSPPPELSDFEKGLEVLQEEDSSAPPKPTIRAVPPSLSGGESVASRTRASSQAASDASFASSTPLASPTRFSNDGDSTPVSRPLSQGHRQTPSSGSETGEPAYSSDIHHRQPVYKPSVESFAFSDISSTSIEPSLSTITASPSLHEAQTATFTSGVRFNNSVISSPSSTNLLADQNTPDIIPRMTDRGYGHQWSSTLSTIPSLSERDSRSIARASRSFGARSQSQDSIAGNGRTVVMRRRGQTVGSTNTSSDYVSSDSSEFSPVPLPLFSPTSPMHRHPSEEKDYNNEHLDTISPLPPSAPLRMKTSGYLRRQNSDAGSTSSSRPGSSQSDMSGFIANNIPAWAKAYYQRGERISIAGPESESSGSIRLGTSHSGRTRTPSESNFASNIHRPRNRPRDRSSRTDSVSFPEDAQPMEGDYYVLGPDGQLTRLSRFSTPHLRSDNRGQLYSMWKAPSLDADLGKTLFSRQNRQILFFCLGFIFPLAWIIAAFLPLPVDPALVDMPSQLDLEQQFAQQFRHVDDKAFQKARWWRNLNRVMSGVGTLLIGVIVSSCLMLEPVFFSNKMQIALAILITRMN
ncbi:hypothetical protein P153DRAFT_292468 [Dothidotthia symphoricarpi CBS 119687]|uniref:Serine-rich protein n=1 Tax=Dothidotthia symphoricarpi CBS 119687 TaxID=1392245 RepID=A0A6A6ACR2_9PLEO|nr:uncharacterized protein P153DRAFT_292468 [Dothidotthia symphoricarpi CBS 119687]KAF2128774.1 hypothetical protein P153DRAFT_292468 [Dothidotthia symphoricarpi CBS 119687]